MDSERKRAPRANGKRRCASSKFMSQLEAGLPPQPQQQQQHLQSDVDTAVPHCKAENDGSAPVEVESSTRRLSMSQHLPSERVQTRVYDDCKILFRELILPVSLAACAIYAAVAVPTPASNAAPWNKATFVLVYMLFPAAIIGGAQVVMVAQWIRTTVGITSDILPASYMRVAASISAVVVTIGYASLSMALGFPVPFAYAWFTGLLYTTMGVLNC
jgi:hypothetical protein